MARRRRKAKIDDVCSTCGKPFKMTDFGTRDGWSSSGICVIEVQWMRGLPYRREKYHPGECFQQAASFWSHGVHDR
jgi:hypothetical protein